MLRDLADPDAAVVEHEPRRGEVECEVVLPRAAGIRAAADPPEFAKIGGVWPMGDSPPVMITALTTESSSFRIVDAPWIDDRGDYASHPHPRPLVLFETVDARLIFADFFARVQMHRARREAASW